MSGGSRVCDEEIRKWAEQVPPACIGVSGSPAGSAVLQLTAAVRTSPVPYATGSRRARFVSKTCGNAVWSGHPTGITADLRFNISHPACFLNLTLSLMWRSIAMSKTSL